MLQELKQYLTQHHADYLILDNPNNIGQRFRFIGPLYQKDVVWDAHLVTLDDFNCLFHSKETQHQQFFEIKPVVEGERYEILIALKLEAIETRHIIMAIMMVRRYKKLSVGYHQWQGL